MSADATDYDGGTGFITAVECGVNAELEALKPLADELGCSLAQLALAWLLHQLFPQTWRN